MIYYFVAFFCCLLPKADCLVCYSCQNVTNTKLCHTNTTCGQGQKCYTSTSGVGLSQIYNLGCKPEHDCLPDLSSGFVGRSIGNLNSCSQCCQVDNCNGRLCSAGIQIVNEVGQCADDPSFDCPGVSALFNICTDVHHAKRKCRKYCGLCNLIDGSWSDWTSWSTCDVTCGHGQMIRTRNCTDPAPAHGGLDCVGDAKEIATCVMDNCPVHGSWSLWSPWGYCSVTCGIGLERRDRTCSNPYPSPTGDHCYGDSRDDRPCFVKACSDGLWSLWNSWEACSATCLGGLQKRKRTCDNPSPTSFGHDCVGNSEEYQPCNNIECRTGVPVSFRATTVSSVSGLSSGRALIYTKTIINNGGGYDNTTGIFTAPESGLYSFVVQTCMTVQNYYYVRIVKDGHIETSSTFYENTGYNCGTTSALISLTTGNKVWVTVKSVINLHQTSDNTNLFQGTKIRV